ncbi:MAG: cation transporter [Firmicutes bacterium]|nr:cation transporter [Bacillota bacterium]
MEQETDGDSDSNIINTKETASPNYRLKLEKRALAISMYGGILFVIIEFVMAIFTTSQSILMDSVYDAVELIMVIASLRIIPLLYRPTTEKHPFGYSQVETIFITIKGSMLTAVTVGLVLSNIQIIRDGGHIVPFASVAAFEFSAVFISLIVILILRKLYKKTSSILVKVEIDSWIIDTIASAGLGIAFILPKLFNWEWLIHITSYLDQIMAIVLSVFILPIPIKTVIVSLRELFLFAPDNETVENIKNISSRVLSAYNIDIITYDIIKTGRKLWISLYFKTPNDTISISALAKIQKELEAALILDYPDLYVELVPEFDL